MLRDELRMYTRSHHERIERVLDLPGSIRHEADYVRLLSSLFGFYMPYEARLRFHGARLRALNLEVDARLKAHRLIEDMQTCGLGKREISGLPLCLRVPQLPTWQHALGSMYVLEGSTLGSQIIARALGTRLRLNPDAQMNFLLSYGTRTGAMWRSFVESLNSIELSAPEQSDVLAAAAETFEAMESWMSFAYATNHSLPQPLTDAEEMRS